jgi:hypothetical protein
VKIKHKLNRLVIKNEKEKDHKGKNEKEKDHREKKDVVGNKEIRGRRER